MGRNNQKILDLGARVVHNRPKDLVRLVDLASKLTIRVAFWAGCDPDCHLAAGRIRMSQAEQEPRNPPRVAVPLDEVERLVRSLADRGDSHRLASQVVVDF